MIVSDRLEQYGVSSDLAQRLQDAGLNVTKIRALAKTDLTKYGLSEPQAAELKKCVARKPIENDLVDILLARNNHVCCVCKGIKGTSIIIHHIVEYEVSQDNSYNNLAVLCPNDHDRAHQPGSLSLGLNKKQIIDLKTAWEKQVEINNAKVAAQSIRVSDEAIDYINIMRIEQMCIQRFGRIPPTSISTSLQRYRILNSELRFDEKYVRKKLSGGQYLFDYINSNEAEHYRQLLEAISEVTEFADLSTAARSGIRKLKRLEGQYSFFIGGVSSKCPRRPFDKSTPAMKWQHRARNVHIVWDGDADYLMSSSSISRQGRTNRYIIYGLVRTVEQSSPADQIEVICSPLLIAQPSDFVDRTPSIAWRTG
ncbi:HNH endonuclease signature motif containing protein [Mesorhizobium sp.]|uniref:HNH endonuclease signature motif containing protein n=1 Tax=Mesorhizobium sp. TaxID=1871066 RepID=UPI000FE4CC15|nr:HNH endonuclease signature motif containing protein [Mesorhizobium sp.]RWP07137.1 MAG: HNH endonuclease [Mesorhizobium sp.]